MNEEGAVIKLLMDIKESLERQFSGLDFKLDSFREQVSIHFDDMNARLDRQGGILVAGSRWSSRMDHWSEDMDKAIAAKDTQIEALIRRIERLEAKVG